jgi:hypothetical protein
MVEVHIPQLKVAGFGDSQSGTVQKPKENRHHQVAKRASSPVAAGVGLAEEELKFAFCEDVGNVLYIPGKSARGNHVRRMPERVQI